MKTTRTRLVADIGGTHARFALFRQGDTSPRQVVKLATADYPDLVTAARAYQKTLAEKLPRDMCVAVAGPVAAERIALTNNHWSFSPGDIRRQLELDSLHIINDFEAMAWAVAATEAHQCTQLGGVAPAASKPVSIIGPGTGFGAAQLIRDDRDQPMVFATEAGHASLAPCDSRELALFDWLLQQGIYPCREALLSGSGLETIYRALAAMDAMPGQNASAADIQHKAVSGTDRCATEALELFCALLGTAAGDQALACGALGGVYITGGIVRRFLPFLQSSRFRQRFDQHGAMQHYLEQIPVFVVTAEHQGLKGAGLAPLKSQASHRQTQSD